jgi:hypothetical protein
MLDPSTGKNSCTLTGYVKLTGNMSILGGIVSMSLEFDLSLTWEEQSGSGSSVTGSATISISISILFFSFSISATATKTFSNPGGSSGRLAGGRNAHALATSPPTFADQMDPSDWAGYCAAFAS